MEMKSLLENSRHDSQAVHDCVEFLSVLLLFSSPSIFCSASSILLIQLFMPYTMMLPSKDLLSFFLLFFLFFFLNLKTTATRLRVLKEEQQQQEPQPIVLCLWSNIDVIRVYFAILCKAVFLDRLLRNNRVVVCSSTTNPLEFHASSALIVVLVNPSSSCTFPFDDFFVSKKGFRCLQPWFSLWLWSETWKMHLESNLIYMTWEEEDKMTLVNIKIPKTTDTGTDAFASDIHS